LVIIWRQINLLWQKSTYFLNDPRINGWVWFTIRLSKCICSFTAVSPAKEFFTYIYMDMSPLPVKGFKMYTYAWLSGPLSRGIFILPHLLWHQTLVFAVSSEGPSHSIASYDTQKVVEDLFLPWSSRMLIVCLSYWLIVYPCNFFHWYAFPFERLQIYSPLCKAAVFWGFIRRTFPYSIYKPLYKVKPRSLWDYFQDTYCISCYQKY
jgi:hypothetical protein